VIRFYFTLILSTLLLTKINGQQITNLSATAGKVFVSRSLEYFKVLNDTSLFSSINLYNDTATFYVAGDSLFIKQRYWLTDQTGTKVVNKLYDYKIITLYNDTIELKNKNWKDPLVFINIEKLREPVDDFKLLQLDMSSPRHGTRKIIVDSARNVTFIYNPIPYTVDNPLSDKNAKPKNIKGKLTPKEFSNFLNLLSRSLPSKLPRLRGCPFDAATSDFEIIIGAKKIRSTGCNLTWIHDFLLDYLYDIDRNKGLIILPHFSPLPSRHIHKKLTYK